MLHVFNMYNINYFPLVFQKSYTMLIFLWKPDLNDDSYNSVIQFWGMLVLLTLVLINSN